MRLEFRGLYQSSYIRFLQELGGTSEPSSSLDDSVTCIRGEGWSAFLEPESCLSFSKSLHLPRTFITFSGDPGTVERVVAQFRLKALRGGG